MFKYDIDKMFKSPKCVIFTLTLLTIFIIKRIQQMRNNKIR